MRSNEPSELARRIVRLAEKSGAYQAEALVYSFSDSVTRFSRNIISQSACSENTGVLIRILAAPNKICVTHTKEIGRESIQRSISEALLLASKSHDESVRSFATKKVTRNISSVFVRRTTEVSEEERTRLAGDAIRSALSDNEHVKESGGTVTVRVAKIAIVNSLGLDLSHKYTGASFVQVVLARSGSSLGVGFASRASNDFSDLTIGVSLEAAKEAVSSIGPKKIELGRYDVIFQPYASIDWLGSFIQLGFSVQRMPSYVKVGSQCASEQLSVIDNPREDNTLMAAPFDAEGTPTRPLKLIERGVAIAQCFDRATAYKAETKSTGHKVFSHDLTYESKFFPAWVFFPANQIVSPGRSSPEELISTSKRAILIKRFMYGGLPMCVSEGEIMQAYSMGTWLVEDGKIKHALPSLRLSTSLSEMAKRIESITNYKSTMRLGSMNVSWVKVRDVSFSEMASMSVPQGVF